LWHLWGEVKIVSKPEGKTPHARPWATQVYNMKNDLTENLAC